MRADAVARTRKLAWVVVVSIASMVLVACGGSMRTSAEPGAHEARGGKAFVELKVPLSSRRDPLVVGAGRDVFVFGGFVVTGGKTRSLGDGAIHLARSGGWRPLPEWPFTKPLYHPSGVWTGREVVVLGAPCGPTSPDTELARCDPGGVLAAAYSPAEDRWRRIDGVRQPDTAGIDGGYPLESTGLGWDGKHAVFSVSSQRPDPRVFLLDPEAETSHWAPAIDRIDATCVVGGQALAVRTGEVGPDGASSAPNPVAVAEPLRVYRLDAAGSAWTLVSETPKPASTGAMFERVVCSAGRLAYLPIMPPPTGFDGGGLWWSADRTAWEPLPSLGAIGYPGEAQVAESQGTKVVWIDGHHRLPLLPPGASRWMSAPKPDGATGRVALDALSGRVLVDETVDVRPPTRLTVGILDPAPYAAPAG